MFYNCICAFASLLHFWCSLEMCFFYHSGKRKCEEKVMKKAWIFHTKLCTNLGCVFYHFFSLYVSTDQTYSSRTCNRTCFAETRSHSQKSDLVKQKKKNKSAKLNSGKGCGIWNGRQKWKKRGEISPQKVFGSIHDRRTEKQEEKRSKGPRHLTGNKVNKSEKTLKKLLPRALKIGFHLHFRPNFL